MRARLFVLASVLVVAGCGGDRAPAPAPPPAPPALTLDQQAAWAISAVDPCAFAEGTPEPRTPHYCVVHTPGGDVAVAVGGWFEHPQRTAGKAVTVGGLLAYQRAEEPGCESAFPLSFTRAVTLTTPGACAPAEPAVVAAAGKLRGGLDTVTRRAPVNPLTRWDLCELPAAALGIKADAPRWNTRNGCVNQFGLEGPNLQVLVRPKADPSPPGPPKQGEVSLGEVNARSDEDTSRPGVDLPPSCGLRWEEGSVAGPGSGVYEVSFSTQTRCDVGVAQAKALRALMSKPPELPRPASLGITPDQPDEALPAACRVVQDPLPGCRAAAPADVPRGAEAVMAAGAKNADVLCAMLASGIRQATGGEARVANNVSSCVGTYGDASMTIELKLADYAPSHDEGDQPVTLGGLPGFASTSGTTRFVDLSPYRDLQRPAGVRLSVASPQQHPPPEVLTAADRIAAAIATTYYP
ncbi:hypothetical protein [Amycolatopsis minnesotensis]|uniref:Uncharacterized protein n=1 Tax=Amycolatopsis minnesotensis TaxID=337894 RepID=A0ABN2RVH2_9PSEU